VSDAVKVRINPAFYRPSEVETLVGNAAKAARELGWSPATSFADLVAEMVDGDCLA
jgi:GDPmannose 4,6-dehydratase